MVPGLQVRAHRRMMERMSNPSLRLARLADADVLAVMSRDLIEQGLGWSWTPARLRRSMADPQTNVVVQDGPDGDFAGFGVMRYGESEAHLLLLAVDPACRRQGTGSALLGWLERSAQVAGIAQIQLEARVTNVSARAFYRFHGYRETRLVPGYYRGREASVRFVKDLRLGQAERL
jgi:ribosomal-protein-alanine N-acetyltransferase